MAATIYCYCNTIGQVRIHSTYHEYTRPEVLQYRLQTGGSRGVNALRASCCQLRMRRNSAAASFCWR